MRNKIREKLCIAACIVADAANKAALPLTIKTYNKHKALYHIIPTRGSVEYLNIVRHNVTPELLEHLLTP
jgi:hypothetical protein